MPLSPELEPFFANVPADKQAVKGRLGTLLSDRKVVPALPAAALKLGPMTQNPSISLEDIAAVIAKEVGMAARVLRVASSPAYGARAMESLDEAVQIVGVRVVANIAYMVAVGEGFAQYKFKMDWRRFWVHSLLVARLTNKLAAAFRYAGGLEYLAGLLHDVGKVIFELHFREEFNAVLSRSVEEQRSHAELETEILGVNHAQVGAALCKCMGLHQQVQRAVWFHHDPLNEAYLNDQEGDGGFLAACVAVADALANQISVNLPGARVVTLPFEEMAEWKFLQRYPCIHGVQLDVAAEAKSAVDDFSALA
ncbi:MAG: HDOD domain-containing protein [Verrucomicrobia bacterium]|nr:HDOD domain-containing protein [Verrucomicrobiota bacterium]